MTCQVAIVDMQPIEPPLGGGRLRLLGLYHALGEGLRATYFGTCDWREAGHRRLQLSPSLEEIDVPLSARHYAAHDRWILRVGSRGVFDLSFDWLARASPEFVDQGRAVIQAADVVIFSHPWTFPLFRDALRPEQLLIYDSQNCEGVLRAQIWDDGAAGTELARHVALLEAELVGRADATWVCSVEDGEQFRRIYGVPEDRQVLVPNGVFTERTVPPSAEQKAQVRAELGLTGPAAIFLGSYYGPNLEALQFIGEKLAPAVPEVTFILAGGASASAEAKELGKRIPNLRLTGEIPDLDRRRWLWAADLAVNPMFSGSGTNIKMFDFMAAGLPTISTAIGARGIDPGEGVVVSAAGDFPAAIRSLLDGEARASRGAAARRLVEERYSWEKISPWLGRQVMERWRSKQATRREQPPAHPHLRVVAQAEPAPAARPALAKRPLAVLTTWNTRCGIAEYTQYLMDALAADGVECLVVDGATMPARLARPGSPEAPSLRVEDMAAVFGSDQGGVARACEAAGVRDLLLQYHSAFFNEEALLRIVLSCRLAGVRVTVTCHDSRRMTRDGLRRISRAGARLLVLNPDEVPRLRDLGVDQVEYVPMGLLEVEDSGATVARAKLGWSEGPVIATFGFLRPHKGLLELLQAFELVQDIWPDAKLLALTSLYPTEDSRAYLQRCLSLLKERQLDQHPNLHLETKFLPIGEVIRKLQAADVIILPYHHSDEGASASGAVALAACRPVIVTRSPIFEELRPHTYQTGSSDPFCLALAICNVLSHRELHQDLLERSRRYGDARGWSRVASAYEQLLFSPRRWWPGRQPAGDTAA